MLRILLSFLLMISAMPAFAADKSETAYDRVMRTKTFRCGYGVWEPAFMKDANTGQLSGIFYDYMNAVGKNLSFKIEYVEETDWTAFGQALETGRIDGFCFAVWPSAARAREMDFTTPIYFSVINAYARADDARFDQKLAAIDNEAVTVTTLDGEMSNTIAAMDYPKAKILSSPQMVGQMALLLNVANGKADVSFTEPATAGPYMLKNPGKLKMIEGGDAIRVFGNTVAIKKNEYALKSLLDTATRELLQDGTIETILKKHEDYPNSFKRVAKSYED